MRGRLVALFLLSLVPVLVGSVLNAVDQRDRRRTESASDTVRLAQLLAGRLQSTFDATFQLLNVVGLFPGVNGGDGICPPAFGQVLAQHTRLYSALALTDAEGVVVCSSAGSNPEARLTADQIASLRAGQEFTVSRALIGPLTKRLVVLAATPLHGDNGVLTGTVAAGIDLAFLSEMAERIELPEGASFLIVDGDGTLLVRYPQPGAWVGRTAVGAPIFVRLSEGVSGSPSFVSEGMDGVRRLFGYAPVETAGSRFFVVVGLGLDGLFDAANAGLVNNLLSLSATLLFAIALASFAGDVFIRRPVASMLATTRAIADGRFEARVGVTRAPGELASLAEGIDAMAADIQEREERLAALSRRILEVQEAERRNLARELHDEIGQSLTAVKLLLQTARQTGTLEPVSEAIGIAERTLQQLRGLSLNLRPPMLDHLGLAATLPWLIDQESSRHGYEATYSVEPEDLRLDLAKETTLFRITQEALTNIARHAGATRVSIRLTVIGNTARLSIRDNGTGFDVARAHVAARGGGSLGLLGMEERASLAGGRLRVRSDRSGTEVVAELPLAGPSTGDTAS